MLRIVRSVCSSIVSPTTFAGAGIVGAIAGDEQQASGDYGL